jgi:hypothetical protein
MLIALFLAFFEKVKKVDYIDFEFFRKFHSVALLNLEIYLVNLFLPAF